MQLLPCHSCHMQAWCIEAPLLAGGLHGHLSCRYALTGKEVVSILMQRLVKVDGKVRTDCTYPAGFMDVIEIDRTDEHFRLIYDTKGPLRDPPHHKGRPELYALGTSEDQPDRAVAAIIF